MIKSKMKIESRPTISMSSKEKKKKKKLTQTIEAHEYELTQIKQGSTSGSPCCVCLLKIKKNNKQQTNLSKKNGR